jgi:hypothetical protein
VALFPIPPFLFICPGKVFSGVLYQGIGVYFRFLRNHRTLKNFYRDGDNGEKGFSENLSFPLLFSPLSPSRLILSSKTLRITAVFAIKKVNADALP